MNNEKNPLLKTEKQPLIKLENITNYALNDMNLSIKEGDFLAIIGPNGSGKTTLLNVISGLAPYKGKVYFKGVSMDATPARKRNIGYVFQDLALFPHLNIRENIQYGLKSRRVDQDKSIDIVNQYLDLLGISHLSSIYPQRLSGGEKQRVAIARALATGAEILLLDEPFSSLDDDGKKLMKEELANLVEKTKVTVIMVTHREEEIKGLATKMIKLSKKARTKI